MNTDHLTVCGLCESTVAKRQAITHMRKCKDATQEQRENRKATGKWRKKLLVICIVCERDRARKCFPTIHSGQNICMFCRRAGARTARENQAITEKIKVQYTCQ